MHLRRDGDTWIFRHVAFAHQIRYFQVSDDTRWAITSAALGVGPVGPEAVRKGFARVRAMVVAWGVLAIGAVAVMIATGIGAFTALCSAAAASVALFLLAMALGADARRRRLAPSLEGLQPIAGSARQKAAALFRSAHNPARHQIRRAPAGDPRC
jgi:hypothetical protein